MQHNEKTMYRIKVLQIHEHFSTGTVIFGREKAGIMKKVTTKALSKGPGGEVSG